MNRRNLLMMAGMALLAGGVGVGSLRQAEADGVAGFAHEPLTLAEMRARDAVIVDIRTPPEWDQTGVVDGAELVMFQGARSFPAAFLAALGDEVADGREVFLICRSGNRSQLAGQALAQAIDNPVTSVAGGMKRLLREGVRTVSVR